MRDFIAPSVSAPVCGEFFPINPTSAPYFRASVVNSFQSPHENVVFSFSLLSLAPFLTPYSSRLTKKAGALAAVAATSFFPAKPLGCYGDGGMIFTDDKNIFDQLLSIRVHGQGVDKYNNVRVGINGRMDSLQAAVLLAKMEIFAEEIEMRQEVAARYSEMLEGKVKVPRILPENISAWAQYSVLHPRRDDVIKKLRENGIPTAVYYPIPLHLQQAFADLGYRKNDFPVAEKIAGEIFSLPMHPYLEKQDQEKICQIILGEA